MTHSPNRRRIVIGLGAAALAPLLSTPALAEDLHPTPEVEEGPFYPRAFPADTDADLTSVAGHGRRAQGTPLAVAGRLLDTRGRPLSGRRIEIWQCDATGHYHHVRERDASLDPDFQGYGVVETDAEGRYSFRTIKPVPYPGRTPHIHFTVVENGRRRLTSQMFVEGEPRNERDFLYRQLGADAKRVTMRLADRDGGLAGSLDIVV